MRRTDWVADEHDLLVVGREIGRNPDVEAGDHGLWFLTIRGSSRVDAVRSRGILAEALTQQSPCDVRPHGAGDIDVAELAAGTPEQDRPSQCAQVDRLVGGDDRRRRIWRTTRRRGRSGRRRRRSPRDPRRSEGAPLHPMTIDARIKAEKLQPARRYRPNPVDVPISLHPPWPFRPFLPPACPRAHRRSGSRPRRGSANRRQSRFP
jgi:hypothetical protein